MIKQKNSNKFLKILLSIVTVCVIFSAYAFNIQKTYTGNEVKECAIDESLVCDLNENLITGLVKYYLPNGKLTNEVNFKDGKIEGLSRIYYPNGNLEVEVKFKDGRKNGFFKSYYPNGNLKFEKNYKDGKLDGTAKGFYKNGDLEYEKNYKNGKIEGLVKKYSEDGTLKIEPAYVYIGEFEVKKCATDESLLCDVNEKLITGLVKYHYSNGKLEREVNFKNGKIEGLVKEYSEDGALKTESEYAITTQKTNTQKIYSMFDVNCDFTTKETFCTTKSGSPLTGILYVRDVNGQLQGEFTFKNGKEDGLIKEYHKNGRLKKETTYKNGKENGLVKEYYENGRLFREVFVKDGKQDGITKVYYENGQIHLEGLYKDGQLNGVLKTYHENGTLQSETVYKNGKQEHPAHIHNFAKHYKGMGASYEEAALIAYCIEKNQGANTVITITQNYQYGNFKGGDRLVELTGCQLVVSFDRMKNQIHNK